MTRRNNLYYLEWVEGHITDPLRYMKTKRYELHDYDIDENVVMHDESFDSEESTAATGSAPAVKIFRIFMSYMKHLVI